MEIWDLFGMERQPLYRTHRRGEKMNDGEYHVDVEIWTVNRNNNLLVTLRDPRKEQYPNKWEVTGGSALSGETSQEAAVRELREETGIVVTEDKLSFLGTYQEQFAFVDIYLLRLDISISDLVMQEGETVGAKWITLEELYEMISDQTFAFPIGQHFEKIKRTFYDCLAI